MPPPVACAGSSQADPGTLPAHQSLLMHQSWRMIDHSGRHVSARPQTHSLALFSTSSSSHPPHILTSSHPLTSSAVRGQRQRRWPASASRPILLPLSFPRNTCSPHHQLPAFNSPACPACKTYLFRQSLLNLTNWLTL